MVDVGQTDVDDPSADITDQPPSLSARLIRLGIRLVVVLVVLAVVVWQSIGLHNQVHSLQKTTDLQRAQIQQLHQDVVGYQNSVTATLSCLESPHTQAALCTQFLK
jgi:hypothetical protein